MANRKILLQVEGTGHVYLTERQLTMLSEAMTDCLQQVEDRPADLDEGCYSLEETRKLKEMILDLKPEDPDE